MFTPKTQRSKCFTIYETFPKKVFRDERNEQTVKAGPIVFVQIFKDSTIKWPLKLHRLLKDCLLIMLVAEEFGCVIE